MPIVDGRYEAKISTVFSTVDEGVDEIKRKVKKSRRIRISGIPMGLLDELVPLLKGKDVMIILPLGAKPTKELKELCPIAVTKAKIYSEYRGEEAFSGSIYFSDVIFSVAWSGKEIFDISTMEYGKCVKCMKGTFDMAWRYSEKVK